MVWLVALILALVLLAAWISGHWFARVIVFLALGGLAIATSLAVVQPYGTLYFLCGLPLAWVISRLPEVYWKRRNRVVYQVRRGGYWVRS